VQLKSVIACDETFEIVLRKVKVAGKHAAFRAEIVPMRLRRLCRTPHRISVSLQL
jgi:hypothetical protein